MLQLYTAHSLNVFHPFKMVAWFFQTASSFPNFDGPNAFFPQIHLTLEK